MSPSAVGWQGTPQGLNSQASYLAGLAWQFAEGAAQLANYANEQGVNGLEDLGFAQADATAFLAFTGYLSSMGQLLGGQIAQASAYNYLQAVSSLVGPGGPP